MLNKRIVVVNQAVGYLFIDLVNALADKYDEVVLIAGKISFLNRSFKSNVKTIKIIRYSQKSILTRFITWIIGFCQIFILLKLKYYKEKVILSSNPPLASILPLFIKNQCSFIIYDIYPEALITSKYISEKNLIYTVWQYLNRKAYKRVYNVITLTKSMANLLSKYMSISKIQVVPPWPAFDKSEYNDSNHNLFVEKYDLKNLFIVLYAGNMGKEYNLEKIIDIADSLKSCSEIKFIIAGEGYKKELISNMVNQKGIKNILLLPYLEKDYYIDALRSMHLGVVAEASNAPEICVPSKIYNLIGQSVPILNIGRDDTELGLLIKTNQLGISCINMDPDSIGEFILKLKNNSLYYNEFISNISKYAKVISRSNIENIVSPIINS